MRGLVPIRAVRTLVWVRRAHGLTASGVEDGETLVVRCWVVTKISFLLGVVTACVLNLLYMRRILHALQAYARRLSCMATQRVEYVVARGVRGRVPTIRLGRHRGATFLGKNLSVRDIGSI